MANDNHSEQTTHNHEVTPVGTYVGIYVLLLVLLAATVGAYYVNLGPLNNVVSLTIAVVKAILVILFFMEVRKSTKLTQLWVCAGFVWFFLMFGIMGDYLTRGWIKVPGW